jgi:aconitate hydratase
VDIAAEPLGKGSDGRDVYLRDVWPSSDEVAEVVRAHVDRSMFLETYASLFRGDDRWRGIPVEPSERYAWQPDSTYVRRAPYFDGMAAEAPAEVAPLEGLRVLALLGDSVTTDHISPAGSIKPNSPAGEYLEAQGVAPKDFNSYGSRRGNHEVMARGTFANVRLRNRLAPGTEGGFTVDPVSGEVTTIFAASETAHAHSIPLMVIAGKEYGTGSSRDWAAKGPLLLGVRVVLAESFERIHRSNLVGMGILPLQFMPGDSADSLGLDGSEAFDVVDFPSKFSTLLAEPTVLVRASRNGTVVEFPTRVRIDTPSELEYYRNQGVLQFVLRRLLRA